MRTNLTIRVGNIPVPLCMTVKVMTIAEQRTRTTAMIETNSLGVMIDWLAVN